MNRDSQTNKGLWLGLLGIVIFSVTLPMTRLATGTPDAPQMSGVFIALGRAVVAAALSAVFLLTTRAPLPRRQDWWPLGGPLPPSGPGQPMGGFVSDTRQAARRRNHRA